MKVKVKKLSEDAILPNYANEGDAGLDLVAVSYKIFKKTVEYSTGIAVEIPEGHVGLLFPRSSVFKKDLMLANGVGVIDSSYRGEIKVIFRKTKSFAKHIYKNYDKVAQLVIVPIPKIEIEESDELSQTERGEKGFGSSGN